MTAPGRPGGGYRSVQREGHHASPAAGHDRGGEGGPSMAAPDGAAWLDGVRFDPVTGLVPAIAQEATTKRVLTLAWMNREALAATAATGRVHYWSRSRGRLWSKGERSGHVQQVVEIRLDCDADAVLVVVRQIGGIACHTGRESCFHQRLGGDTWVAVDPVLKDPAAIYGHE